MALSEELPIYKTSIDLLEQLTDLQKGMARFYRYTLGARMTDECLDMLGLIYRANMVREERERTLVELIVHYRRLQMLLRVLYRKKGVSSGRYAVLVQMLDSIGRQSTAWLASCHKQQG